MRSLVAFLCFGMVGSTLLAGCNTVSRTQYDDLMLSYRTLQEQNVACEGELESARASNNMLREQIVASGGKLDQLSSENQQLSGQINDLEGQYSSLQGTIDSIDFGPLPVEMNRAIRNLVNANPGLLEFDEQRGMIRFMSDFTFDLGSTDLKPAAQQSIRTLATLLNSGDGSGFEVKVVGHTDNVRIARTSTRAQHPTNMHLSVHRAIAVRDAFVNSSVDARRIQVAGFGEYRPIVANGSRGAAENRRVEIYLLPLTAELAELPASPSSSDSTQASQPDDETFEPMK